MVPCIAILCYNNPTRCSCTQSILFYCNVTLHVSGAFHTHHQEYINCIYSLRYRSYIGAATFLQRGRIQTRPRWRKEIKLTAHSCILLDYCGITLSLFCIWYTRIMKLYIKHVHGYVELPDDD